MRQNNNKQVSSGNSRGAPKTEANKKRRLQAAEKRRSYWKSPEGQARKEAKMNTPEKIQKRADSKVARAERRRQRVIMEQERVREQARKNADQQLG